MTLAQSPVQGLSIPFDCSDQRWCGLSDPRHAFEPWARAPASSSCRSAVQMVSKDLFVQT